MIDKSIIEPEAGEEPAKFADRLGVYYGSGIKQAYKKQNGQFFTPFEVAQFMASHASVQKAEVHILDPGCGSAILSCALVEYLFSSDSNIQKITLTAYETEEAIIPLAEKALTYLESWAQSRGIAIQIRLYNKDFVTANPLCFRESNDLFDKQGALFDIVMANPPYFKLPIHDPRVNIANVVVNGHPNIYTIFMAMAAKLLKINGELIFITPRSYASGGYFRRFRHYFFSLIELANAHLFTSRKSTFSRDKVLQETVIITGIRKTEKEPEKEVFISSSTGLSELSAIKGVSLSQQQVLNLNTKEKVLYLPTSERDKEVLKLFKNWPGRLSDYHIEISTGPVVAFRSRAFIQKDCNMTRDNVSPLIWLHNVKPMQVEWPIEKPSKGQYITIADHTKPILLANKNYVLLRRFSSKEDAKRLVAAPYFCNFNHSTFLGVENKVNYIYRPKGHLLRNEVVGLCALLNSQLFDDYFRILNGNVNVSATEIRDIPLPSLDTIKEIGDQIILLNDFSVKKVNEVVSAYLEPAYQMDL